MESGTKKRVGASKISGKEPPLEVHYSQDKTQDNLGDKAH